VGPGVVTPQPRYAQAAALWRGKGWPGVLPLPQGRKGPPPGGFTGADGRDPTDAEADAWVGSCPYANAALRLPVGVLGLDVDAYGAKRGGKTWARHLQEFGAPPHTWIVTSRSDGTSGIRLFRCDLPGPFRASLNGGDVDVIHHGHRYVVLPPSLHPEGRTYVLVEPSGRPASAIPSPQDLPPLPASWHEALHRQPAHTAASPRPSRRPTPERGTRPAHEERQLQIALSVLCACKGKRYRDNAGVTIDELAAELGISRARASHLEAGQLRAVRLSLLLRYGAFLERILGESPGLVGRGW